MATKNAAGKNRSTNMEAILNHAMELLNQPVTEDDMEDFLCTNHPLLPYRYISCYLTGGYNGIDIIKNPKDLEMVREAKRKELNECAAPLDVFKIIVRKHRFRFLKDCEQWLSVEDLSTVLRYIWDTSEYADNTKVWSKKDIARLFSECDLRILMSEEEYEAYEALPDELTVYRGVCRSNKKLVKSFSWTLEEDAVGIGRYLGYDFLRFGSVTGKAYTAKIKKQDVIAYFGHRSEVIVNPSKLYECEQYEAYAA